MDVTFEDVSKSYRLRRSRGGESVGRSLLRRLHALRGRPDEFWAVRHVSFEIQRGEALGIVGPNGAGKSTILKLLSRITAPTEGEITIHGRLAALIEIGSGFHPELTGRENVFLNGSILGMRRREIAQKLESIVEFSDIGEFIDIPVKWYSSGMHVRLAFAIAAHLDPDILVVDEVLAVGDLAFQPKCTERITELKRAGTTLVLISHDLATVERLCDRALLMLRGELVASGSPTTVVKEYQRMAAGVSLTDQMAAVSGSAIPATVTHVTLHHHADGGEGVHFRTGWPLLTRVHYTARQPLDDIVFEVYYFTKDGAAVRCVQTTATGERIDLQPGRGTVEFEYGDLPLLPGVYGIGVAVRQREASCNSHWWYGEAMLHVQGGVSARGDFFVPHTWRFNEERQPGFEGHAMPPPTRRVTAR